MSLSYRLNRRYTSSLRVKLLIGSPSSLATASLNSPITKWPLFLTSKSRKTSTEENSSYQDKAQNSLFTFSISRSKYTWSAKTFEASEDMSELECKKGDELRFSLCMYLKDSSLLFSNPKLCFLTSLKVGKLLFKPSFFSGFYITRKGDILELSSRS